ncbi:collagen-binding domain-containing protein [Psychroflexus aestuariivivens]|uniref:collagen-binding domain-containing protein n=1 Tax=Psychroflexus aestuariivivens TaxID=1795040 RepID=UPI000FD762F0|nr:collagen-binding domain-containing protein [Psychroflexus aestuariivivens]
MSYNYLKKSIALFAVASLLSFIGLAQSPTDPAQGFNVFTESNLILSTNESEGPVACGGDLTLAGNYQVATNQPGNFMVNGVKIGLIVNGKVNYQSGNALQVNQNAYIKIGNSQGSNVWYYDQNNAASPIRITPNSNYNSSPKIMLQANSNQLSVGANNNPVFQDNLIDFANAFQEMRTTSSSISECDGNAELTNPNGQPIPNTSLPNQVKINLNDGVNYLNVTGSDMNNVQVFTYNQQPSASKILIINVDAPGTFNWNVWNQAGIGFNQCPYILYNFYNTTDLNIVGHSTIEGTVFAPFADITKTANQSNIEGQVIGKTLIHSGGEMHYANFSPSISGCSAPTGEPPVAGFDVNQNSQCLAGNSFEFSNTSNTGTAIQPEAPLTYNWNFGDGTTSDIMNPSKTYDSAGTYEVTLTTTNDYGTDSESFEVIVLPEVDADVSVTTLSLGSNSVTKQFTLNNESEYTDFSWSMTEFGSDLFPNQDVVDFEFTEAGYYELSVSTVDVNTCENITIVPVVIESEEVNTGNDGGLESESLGDALSKRYVERKMQSKPTVLNKTEANRFEKNKFSARPSHSLSLWEMFPAELESGNVAHITSPTDILDYTVADEVLSVDFSINGQTKGVVLGIKTTDRIYNHTKASCDRLRGAEIINVRQLELDGYHFLMQALKQRNGTIEYAISFAVGQNSTEDNYRLQSNWYVHDYNVFENMYNFQVWSTNPENTEKLVQDILNNLRVNNTLQQTETRKLPNTYAAKVSREGKDMLLKLRSSEAQNIEISMNEVYSETGNSELWYNPYQINTEETLRLEIKDSYEFDGQIKVEGEIQDVFYHADGNWGLDYDSSYTTIEEYEIYNDFNRTYHADEMPIHRNVNLKANSEYDYLTLYKSLLPGNLSADYSEYKYLVFTAKGSGLLELDLVKSSIEAWEQQFKTNVHVGEENQTYYIPFDAFTSSGTNGKITAEDLSMITFTFLPMQAGTNELDLNIKDVKFAKSAPASQNLYNQTNELVIYPNPSKGNINCLLYSENTENATLRIHDVTGKQIYSEMIKLDEGRNSLLFNLDLDPGLIFLNISSASTNFGTSKIVVE